MEYNVHRLSNGIRLLHVPSSSSISHACIVINAGSRDETEQESGMAHFIEHLIFKRTQKRSTNQILSRLESVGGDLNAYTTKEYTCIHASFLNPYLERTLELFNDIVFHSVFPEEEIEKEKSIVLDEIASYLDQPEEAIYDDFEDIVFKQHPLGRNILGTKSSVKKITKAQVLNFIKNNYHTDKIVVAVLGNYSFSKVTKIGSKHFDAIEKNTGSNVRVAPTPIASTQLILKKPIVQAHSVLGMQTYSRNDPYKTGLLLLNNIIGGTGMSSILNLQIREKHGIAYTIETNYSPLSDTGIFTLYFGTEKDKVERALDLIYKEFDKFRKQSLSSKQLQNAKNKFIGQIALGEENRISVIISMAKSLMDYDKIDDLETIFAKINAVSTEEIETIAHQVLNPTNLSALHFYPKL
ncbi:MAG: insulinase family protein [Sphingobacteriaceae bacterium]|nr:insulinase family protein [Sphingobacteriaceae bacterium]